MERQVQQLKNKSLEEKLDEILKRLETLTNIVEDEIYPDESMLKVSYLKKEAKSDRAIKSGKTKVRTFRNFADFDRAIG